MSATTVHVKNISGQTTEQEVRDFFSFCGKISDISVTKESDGIQSAAVTFEKPTAAKVSSASTLEELSSDKSGPGEEGGQGEDLSQEDKPRSRIVAEYLAHGYVISDKAIERAIALDNQHGISTRFTNALQQFDAKYNATGKAQELDQKYGVSEKAAAGFSGLHSYFEKAMGTPTGQRVRSFYIDTNKQVMDVHGEARRLADLKGGKATPSTVPGTDKTACSCHSESGKCGCSPGQCACASCPKNASGMSVPADGSAEKV